ncbi:BspA family leucine-rich repeat surface protein [Psittacicella hinzii]|uniref:BspA family leucine-rich repeat surface protein n=1 Tax=Psittacicella hinzii TaxID=2028575 RepID=UPI001CA5F97D|nr:BspA family leucine-rich repeat surface protein [Psittacicella hinzii]
MGELYGKDLSKVKEKFIFTKSSDLKLFISDYLDYNKLRDRIDLNFIDVSQIKDLNHVFSGEFDVIEKDKFKEEDFKNLNVVQIDSNYSVCKSPFSYNIDISRWDTRNVTTLGYTFACSLVDFNISNWNTSNVTNMHGAFMLAINFNSDISNWNTERVTSLNSTFAGAKSFAGDLSKWNVSNVEDLNYTFFQAREFNSDLSNWDVSNVTNMRFTFALAEKFTSDLSKWKVSNVRSFFATFAWAYNFYSDLSQWNVSNAVILNYMFAFTHFSTNLNDWNLSSVKYAQGTFLNSEFRESDFVTWKNKVPSLYSKLRLFEE